MKPQVFSDLCLELISEISCDYHARYQGCRLALPTNIKQELVIMKLNKYLFNTVQPCLHQLHVLNTVFSWRPLSSFSLWIILLPPSPPPAFIQLPLLNQCDGCLVPLAWGLMAGGRGFAGHGGVTLSRGLLCQGGSPWTSRAPTSTKRRGC